MESVSHFTFTINDNHQYEDEEDYQSQHIYPADNDYDQLENPQNFAVQQNDDFSSVQLEHGNNPIRMENADYTNAN